MWKKSDYHYLDHVNQLVMLPRMMSRWTIVLLLNMSSGFNDPKHQGKFHLLAIVLIPGLLVTFFLSNSWAPTLVAIAIAILLVLVVYILGRK